MESNREVLGIPGDGRSGMSICIVVHVMKAACKYVEVLLASMLKCCLLLQVTSSTLSGV